MKMENSTKIYAGLLAMILPLSIFRLMEQVQLTLVGWFGALSLSLGYALIWLVAKDIRKQEEKQEKEVAQNGQ